MRTVEIHKGVTIWMVEENPAAWQEGYDLNDAVKRLRMEYASAEKKPVQIVLIAYEWFHQLFAQLKRECDSMPVTRLTFSADRGLRLLS